MISQENLNGFTGTENYFKMYMGLKITDGVKFFMEKCECFWFVCDLAVINAMDKNILKNKADGNTFLLCELKINRAEKKCEWILKEDTNEPILYAQKYDYTDLGDYFSDDLIKFYLIDGVLLLPSEY